MALHGVASCNIKKDMWRGYREVTLRCFDSSPLEYDQYILREQESVYARRYARRETEK